MSDRNPSPTTDTVASAKANFNADMNNRMNTETTSTANAKAKRARIPRRTPIACQPCRAAKVRCTGEVPCARCTRRRKKCEFAVDDPKVMVSERYLLEIEKQLENASKGGVARDAGDTLSKSEQHTVPTVSTSGITQQQSSGQSPELCSVSIHEPDIQASSRNQLPTLVSQTSPGRYESRPVSPTKSREDLVFHNNPLVEDLSYLKDPAGRIRYMGPTSTWSFFRRLAVLVEGNVPQALLTPSDPFNVDGTAFRLRWDPFPMKQSPDVSDLPNSDYALLMYHTTKYHLGFWAQAIDEQAYLSMLVRFEDNPEHVARDHRLWFAEYLLVLAFAASFTSSVAPVLEPAGARYAARALALIPDVSQLHDDGVEAIELLALAALYCHAIDMRVSAYQFIGQALRLSFVEGLHRRMPSEHFDEQQLQRYRSLWWIVYVLDQRLSAQMGTPSSLSDEEISALLPQQSTRNVGSITLTLAVKFSRVFASIISTVYSADERIGVTFVKNTKRAIERLAEVAQEADETLIGHNQLAPTSRSASDVTLMYHHCILNVTRPIVMCLLKSFLETSDHGTTASVLSEPISSLLRTSIASGLATLKIFCAMETQGLLESFLPFHLEYIFSSAISLRIVQMVVPEYMSDRSWRLVVDCLLDHMIQRGSMIANIRKAELAHFDQLLSTFDTSLESLESNIDHNDSSQQVPTPSFTANGSEPREAWDQFMDQEGDISMAADELFDLAMQFGLLPELHLNADLDSQV